MNRLSRPTSQPITLICTLAVLLFGFKFAQALILNVPQDYQTIQTAIDSASMNDTVLVRNGRYQENLNFNGKTLTLGSQYLTTGDTRFIAQTVIDGGWNGRSAIRMAAGEGGLITGFTIENDSTDYGAGIYIRLGQPTISHMVIQNCRVLHNGTAIYITGGAVVNVRDVVMKHNQCDYVGGAMSIYTGSSAVIERCLMYDNYSNHVGGAIHAYSSNVTLRNCTIADNASLHTGGAIYLTNNAVMNVTDCILWHNEPDEIWSMAGFNQQIFKIEFSDLDGGHQMVFLPVDMTQVWGVGNIDDDPLFGNPDAGDYTLGQNSPCIDAGNYESVADADGTRRDLGFVSINQGNGGQRVRQVPSGYHTIQAAIDAAVNGDVVLVQPRTYRENVLISDKRLLVGSRILVTGDASYSDSTIIDGGGHSYVVAFTGNITNENNLQGFTIRNGRQNFGGGIDCRENTSPLLEDLIVRDNIAVQWGGGVYCTNGSAPILRRVILENNRAYRGGGMACVQSRPILENCIIRQNTTNGVGGGLCGIGSAPSLSYIEFSANHAAEDGGAAIFLWDSFAGNAINLVNLTLAGNIVDNDWANTAGLGILRQDGDPFAVHLSNSIIYSNSNHEIAIWDHDNEARNTVMLSVSHSDLRGGQDGIVSGAAAALDWQDGNIDSDPLFADADHGDYHLTENSPCIDAADPASPPDPDYTRADMGAFAYPQHIERESALFRVPDDFPTIQGAIEMAQSLDTILVSPGRYDENLNFNGKDLVLGSWFLTTRNPRYIGETILDGGGRASCIILERSESQSTAIVGFTITGGRTREGGGVFCFRTSPRIDHCVITGNEASEGGGGIYTYGASPILTNLTVVNNHADQGAGGMHLRNGAFPYLKSCVFYGNGQNSIVYSGDRASNGLTIWYSDLEGGQDEIAVNNNGTLNWYDGNISDDPQFLDAEQGNYGLSEHSPCIDTGDPELAGDPDGSRGDMGALPFDQRLGHEETFAICLDNGWNLIGSPLQPIEPAMTMIWHDLVTAGLLVITKDQDGNFYWPAHNFSNLPDWDGRFGYLAKVTVDTALTISGVPLPSDEPIPLRAGWTIISYLPPDPADVVEAFADIRDDILLVKDGSGYFYNPQHDFSNMAPLERGNGYQVAALRDTVLVWGGGQRRMAGAWKETLPKHFTGVVKTGRNMSLLVSAECRVQNAECEIGVFTEKGVCVGAATIPNHSSLYTLHSTLGLAVWGDDETTEKVDGAVEGEALSFRLWDGKRERPVEATWSQPEAGYQTNALQVVTLNADATLPTEFALFEPYPNPFNSTSIVRFDLPAAQRVSLRAYDVSGREAAVILEGAYQAGRHSATWQADRMAAGVYLLRLEAGGQVRTQKVVLVK